MSDKLFANKLYYLLVISISPRTIVHEIWTIFSSIMNINFVHILKIINGFGNVKINQTK